MVSNTTKLPEPNVSFVSKQLVSINWHSSLEGVLRVPEEDEEAYYKARKHFHEIVHRPEMEVCNLVISMR